MIDGLKPYPAMKDSGVTWLGKVPSHWPVLPNRALFMEVKDRNHPEEEMLSVTITQGIVRQKTILADSSKKDSSNQDKSAYKLVKQRDLAYNKMRAWQGAIGVSDVRGIISPAYVVMRPHESYCPRYFHYLYRTPHFAKEAERWSYGITSDMWSLRPEHFKMIYTSVPTREEQSAIVRFLDHADGRIRRYIRAKQKLNKLLEEQKKAIIHRAVTRGLDPNVRLRPSGVEWLGDMPAHWDVVPLRWHIAIGSGDFIPTDAASDLPDADHAIPVIGGNGVMGYCKRFNSEGTTIVIGRVGALCGNVHLVEGHAWVTDNALGITRTRGFEPEYFVLQLRTMNLNRLANANAQPLITGGIVKEQRAVMPPRTEQQALVAALTEATKKYDAAVSSARLEISLLREYRTRLIADVVTGKLDVREAAAKLPNEPEDMEVLDTAEELEGVDDVGSDVTPDDETVEAVA